FWSLGNESQWSSNIAAERRFASEHDPSRPVIFSYPNSVPIGVDAFDIYSKHYPDASSDLRSAIYPLLNDEFAHISCYNLDTLRRDPGVRNFWGDSIRQFGDRFITSDGCLGGSIWAGIDEVFLLPGGVTGYGPWGIIDGWRREKPEYWLTKKAFSPIRIEERPLPLPQKRETLSVPVGNAFDHTNFNELEIRWTAGSGSGRLSADLAPHQPGYLEIPSRDWQAGDKLRLDFRLRDMHVDSFELCVGSPRPPLPKPQPPAAVLRRGRDNYVVTGQHFSINVSQATGLISEAKYKERVILKGGPFLDLGTGPLMSHWLLRHCETTASSSTITIVTTGECKRGEGIESIPVEFEMEIDGDGLITTRYRFRAQPAGRSQIGVAYLLSEDVEKLSWQRDALWSVYPEDHIGRPKGVAFKKAGHAALSYRAKPEWPWSQDMEDAFLWGRRGASPYATNDFRSLKPNIRYAACSLGGSEIRARAEADGDVAVRAAVLADGKIAFSLYNFWPYPDLAWGNYTGPAGAPAVTTREVRLRLADQPEE
ncbi:MAG: hypothetical protein KGL37_02370, partial [Acidobacteriota bacterium]|nr:hypothetical protein [Acidobacteriota bacterium]